MQRGSEEAQNQGKGLSMQRDRCARTLSESEQGVLEVRVSGSP